MFERVPAGKGVNLSGNGTGITIVGPATGDIFIQCNYIGTDRTGGYLHHRESAAIAVVATEDNDKGAPNESKKKRERIGPYFKRDLETARKLLESIRRGMGQDGERRPYREALDAVLKTEESRQALEVAYEAVIRPHDFLGREIPTL